MTIDSHQHFWRFDPRRDAWITDAMRAIRRDFLPDELARTLTTNAIDGCVAVQADQSDAETHFLLDFAKRYPFIKGVVGWVDLRSPRLDEALDRLCADTCLRGVRHVAQAEPDDFLLTKDVVRGISRLGRYGLTYDILIHSGQLPAAIALAARLPDQQFVLDHLAKPAIKEGTMEPWVTWIRDLARRPNVCCKLSGLVTEADWIHWRPEHIRPYLDVALDAFGAGRVMFGSDWPVCLVAAPYERVLGVVTDYVAALSADERGAIMGGNAVRTYRLD